MSKVLTAALVFLTGTLFGGGSEPIAKVDAQCGDYDGQRIKLFGGVSLEHHLGQVEAESAEVWGDGRNSDRFSMLNLSDAVRVELKSGGVFHCSAAYLDHDRMQGRFLGDRHDQFVTYSDSLHSSTRDVPIFLRGRMMTVEVSELEEAGSRLSQSVKRIQAEHSVTIDYDKQFTASSDRLVYERDQNPFQCDSPLPGYIYLSPADAYGTCQVASVDGDMIKAQEIQIDVRREQVSFDKPRGALFVRREDDPQRIDFSGNQLTWNRPENLLTLKDRVVVFQRDMGTLTCDDCVEVRRGVANGRTSLTSIASFGKTELTYADPHRSDTHYMRCHGTCVIDPIQQITTLQSMPTALGSQVFFEDSRGKLFANRIVVSYGMEGDSVIPTKVRVDGDVKIVNSQTQTDGAQYALADVVEYDPDTQTMRLWAREDGRVLFFDLTNRVQVSAPAVNIRRDGCSGKEAVQGEGDVRFQFGERERLLLTEAFEFDQQDVPR